MRYAKLIAIAGMLVLLYLAIGCSKKSSDAGTAAFGSSTAGSMPSNITITLTDVASAALVASIPSSGSVNVNATVTDANNNVVSGATVSFAVSNSSAGSVSSSTAVTNSTGVATVTFNANAVNLNVTITASVTAANGAIVNTAIALTIGNPPPPVPAAIILDVSPLSVNILEQATISVNVLDSGGNAAFNTVVTLNTTPTTTPLGSFSASSSVTSINVTTDTSGKATTTFYAGGISGTAAIQATITSVTPNIFKSSSISISSVPSSLSISAVPATISNAATSSIAVDVRNVLNNAVPDGTMVSFSCLAGNCNAGTYPATSTTVNGQAQMTFTASATDVGMIVLKVSAGTAPNTVEGSVSITVNAATTSSISFVSAVEQLIPVGSGTSVVTFRVIDTNGTGKPNVPIDFQLFGPTGSTLGTGGGTTDQQSSGANGDVATTLHAGQVAGPARIVASTMVGGILVTASSGAIAIGGGLPSATHFDLATASSNVPAYMNDTNTAMCLGESDSFTVFIADRYFNYNILEGTAVSFFASSGAIDTMNTTGVDGTTSVILRTQSPWPTAVAPLPGEMSWTDGFGVTHNPRDGWVAITAITTGEETFFDTNANGHYDLGEPYTDEGEPHVDNDRTFSYSAGDLFFDWPSYVTPQTGNAANPNGIYDYSNSVWDEKIPLHQSIYVAFTGPPHVGTSTTRIELSTGGTPTIDIVKDDTATFYVYVSDINMNPPMLGTVVTAEATNGTVKVLGSGNVGGFPSLTGMDFAVVELTSDNTGTLPLPAKLTATITWPGPTACPLKVENFLTYPGTIRLMP